MRVLITGGKGQLGTTLRELIRRGSNALGPIPDAYRNCSLESVGSSDVDLSGLDCTLRLIQELRPDTIFQCAAFTQVDRCETEPGAALRGNALVARNTAMAAQAVGAKLVHVSTDYVFDGSAADPIPESALPHPLNVYGHTKLLGESYVRDFCKQYFILRTAWLYGKTGGNFVKTILRLAREQGSVTVVDDQIGCPTYAEDLAWHMLQIACSDEFGLYHVTGQGSCSWYDFAREILRLSGIPCEVKPCTTAQFPRPARRPAYAVLAHQMLAATLGDRMRPWQEALSEYMQLFDKASGEIRS